MKRDCNLTKAYITCLLSSNY
uniref:Uncharacterized protein n=1 Tax=Anguilla anguilla TaxID=7936 RepID=A0A0E9T298_ANGAN